MTRKDAIEILRGETWIGSEEMWQKAMNMAIKSLEQESCEDCVSREAVLEWIKESVKLYANTYSIDMLNMWMLFEEQIKAMPSITPTRKKSKWITRYHGFPPEPTTVCLKCGFDRDFYIRPISFDKIKFCPNCGEEIESEG